ncbi:uncharacterized protein BDZ99DRAFT_462062 [Mytilinidion resinicola]|uniref:SAP domain-containing protein n=1 Tax=Mytilinidion resinicola TaxID=574789 RepID=A0A6A6YQC8_9PEZI|nr:uncharacterized protein BDZ99DRAFT_462062 [Mytilinidion resinicola]KAF2810719.1 hypothetical protein BDZ99DRAFT_462062 [Mytilinidion resinicola]
MPPKMPRAKRPLAETDPNASTGRTTRSKVAKLDAPKGKENKTVLGAKRTSKQDSKRLKSLTKHVEEDEGLEDYANTSNNRLGWLLLDRGLPYGTTDERDVMIMRLEIADATAKELNVPPYTPPYFPPTTADIRNAEASSLKKQTDFASKDNSKLRSMLEARKLSTYGTRDAPVQRLEAHPTVDYEQYTTDELSAMASRRHMRMDTTGPKAVKIARLRMNDELKRDTGNTPEGELYGAISAMEMFVGAFRRDKDRALRGDYSFVRSFCRPASTLKELLHERNLPESGNIATKMERLRKDDARRATPFATRIFEKRINDARSEWEKLRVKFEEATGRPLLCVSEDLNAESKLHQRDPVRNAPKDDPPVKHMVDYDWRSSRWADRNRHQLVDIAKNRGMPHASGAPKAAMIKWLETGEIEYEEYYTTSLHAMCSERGIDVNQTKKKVEIIRLPKEHDEEKS